MESIAQLIEAATIEQVCVPRLIVPLRGGHPLSRPLEVIGHMHLVLSASTCNSL
jgi:hypothetical protein